MRVPESQRPPGYGPVPPLQKAAAAVVAAAVVAAAVVVAAAAAVVAAAAAVVCHQACTTIVHPACLFHVLQPKTQLHLGHLWW